MGKAVNKVFLIGRLTRDVELRATSTGKNVASFTLAVDKQKEGTNFLDVTAWGQLAELLGKYVQKGSKLFVEGVLDQQTWEQDGQKRSKIVVIARDVSFLDSRSDAPAGSSDTQTSVSADDKPIDLSEIPFQESAMVGRATIEVDGHKIVCDVTSVEMTIDTSDFNEYTDNKHSNYS